MNADLSSESNFSLKRIVVGFPVLGKDCALYGFAIWIYSFLLAKDQYKGLNLGSYTFLVTLSLQ